MPGTQTRMAVKFPNKLNHLWSLVHDKSGKDPVAFKIHITINHKSPTVLAFIVASNFSFEIKYEDAWILQLYIVY